MFDWEKAIALDTMQGNRGSSPREGNVSWVFSIISWRGGSLLGFLELQQARGVYSRVTTGMPILNGSLFSEVRTLV